MKNAHGVQHLYEDYNEMLKEMGDAVDAISVCAPNGVHFPAAMAALNVQKACGCAKSQWR